MRHRLIHDHGYRVRGHGTPTITHETITPTWAVEPLDLTAARTALLPERPMPSARHRAEMAAGPS